ncbi:MAG: M28 family peptidase [Bacteroidales bacterium]|nr:M28 family peptidase [Bacteroidales bacterium]
MTKKISFSIQKYRLVTIVILLTLFSTNLSAQIFEPDINLLKEHLRFLSSDSLKGRAPGTIEDSIAAYYIASRLLNYGMVPLIGDSPVIPFTFTLKREVGESSFLKISGDTLAILDEFSLSPLSPTLNVRGRVEYVDEEVLKSALSGGDRLQTMSIGQMDKRVALVKTSQDSVMFLITPLIQLGYSAVLFYNQETPILPSVTISSGSLLPIAKISYKIAGSIIDSGGADCELESVVDVVKGRSYNIAAVSPGYKNSYIMVGAHYDHLGLGGSGSGSLSRKADEIHNGADDNASGVVAAIEAGRLLSSNGYGCAQYGFAVAAFGAEERGLIGSRILADTLSVLLKLPALMLNMDMVGRMNEMKLQAGGAGTFKGADSIINDVNRCFNLNMVITQEGYGPSDHASFYTKGVPVLYFTTGVHSQYHTPEDVFELINFDGIKVVTAFVSKLISGVLNSELIPEYQKSEAPSPSRRSFRVTLGVIPDFTYEKGDGFRVGSVTDGRAAQKAGMLEGDIITEMGSRKINNIYDYMSALGDLKPGERCEVTVVRSGDSIRLIVEL